jgi:hypothetical protein
VSRVSLRSTRAVSPRLGLVPPLFLTMAVAVTLLAGCGGSLTSSGYNVSGAVTWKNQPLDQGTIQFLPEAGPGEMVGTEINNGQYRLPNPPGLVPGTYRVRINSLSGAGQGAGSAPDTHLSDPHTRERIPPDYNAETTLKAELTAGGTTTFDFNLTDKGGPKTAARASR